MVPVMPCRPEFPLHAGEHRDGRLHFPVHTAWTYS